jgi:hypothetical protein
MPGDAHAPVRPKSRAAAAPVPCRDWSSPTT